MSWALLYLIVQSNKGERCVRFYDAVRYVLCSVLGFFCLVVVFVLVVFSPSLSRCSKVCIKEIARFSFIVALSNCVACRCLCGLLHPKKKKRKNTHERCTCHAASLSAMVEPDSTFLRSSTCCSRWTEVCGKGLW